MKFGSHSLKVSLPASGESKFSVSGGGVIFRIGWTVWDSAGPFAFPNARNNINTLVTKF